MYLYDQGRTSGAFLGIGWLDAFAKSPKKNKGASLEELESEIKVDGGKAKGLEEENKNLVTSLRRAREENNQQDVMVSATAIKVNEAEIKNLWKRVNDNYDKWFQVRDKDNVGRGYTKGWQIYALASRAAMMLGDAASGYQRIITAMVLAVRDPELNASGSMARDKKDEVLKDLLKDKLDLEDNWVDVDIGLLRKSEGRLDRSSGPFTAEEKDRSAAFERAKKILRNEKKFQGLLPIGDYTIDGEAVSLGTKFTIPRWKKAIISQKRNRPLDPQLESKEPMMPLEGPTAIGYPLPRRTR